MILLKVVEKIISIHLNKDAYMILNLKAWKKMKKVF